MPYNVLESSPVTTATIIQRQPPDSLQRLDSRLLSEGLVGGACVHPPPSAVIRVAAALPTREIDVELVCAGGVGLPCSSHILRLFSPLMSDLLLLSEHGARQTTDDSGGSVSCSGASALLNNSAVVQPTDGPHQAGLPSSQSNGCPGEACALQHCSVWPGCVGGVDTASSVGTSHAGTQCTPAGVRIPVLHRLHVQGEEAEAWAELLALLLPVCPRAAVTWENASRVAGVADRYHFPAPLRWVQEFLVNPCTGLCTSATAPHAVLKALLMADRFGFQDVRGRCLNFIHAHAQRMELTVVSVDAPREAAGNPLSSLSDATCQAVQLALQRKPRAPALTTSGSGRGVPAQMQLCTACKHCKYSTACGYCLKCFN